MKLHPCRCSLVLVSVMLVSSHSLTMAATNDDANGRPILAQQARAFEEATEKIRADCVRGRRIVCGRIVKLAPDGLVVESGYTNLMRPPLDKSWLIPGTVQTSLPGDLVEENQSGCACVGLVFLTGLPKSRVTKPKLYDYVVIQAYPMGQYNYNSVGTVQRTIRCFSASLSDAIKTNRKFAGITPPNDKASATAK